MKQHVVMVAGGTGTRMRQSTAKQFLNVEGLPLMWWTLRRFREALPEAEVTLVLHESLFEEFYELERTFGSAGAMHVVPGGAERFHSVLEGLKTLPDEGVVGIHDAVRPFPSVEAIQRCFELAARSGSAIPVVPVKDSIRRVEEDRSEAVDRGALRAVQTPQCFDLATLKAAFDTPYRPEFTDDASVYEAAGHTVNLCEGDPWNVKVTTPEDLTIAEAFVRAFRPKG
ncbi:MAG: 2-C-methyl-D-erythritol 4-phosphate cytidylyltransferase [Bacteroidota bacterium]|nr:2-C-methyl-D-erythritol 4-phosphate cytidylyltransferase [Bacteroidota bacterium]MEC8360659.1 2-C-methyl-D-erythritol 4-phosphate cytidylyltransferase [Bacteroidota bacterium]